jgi:hypothetical protein
MNATTNTANKENNMSKKLNSKGLEYRGIILDGMIKNIGHDATVAIMENSQLLGLVNATAQKAADAPTAELAGRIAAHVIGSIIKTAIAEYKSAA